MLKDYHDFMLKLNGNPVIKTKKTLTKNDNDTRQNTNRTQRHGLKNHHKAKCTRSGKTKSRFDSSTSVILIINIIYQVIKAFVVATGGKLEATLNAA